MNRDELLEEIQNAGTFSFSRSGGPGGQNVNKVNTKVTLTVKPDDLVSLNETQKDTISRKLYTRINAQGELFIQMQQERSQLMNRQLAAERLADLIIQSLKKPKPRKKTRPTKASVEKRLERKKKVGRKKKSRGRFSGME